MQMPYIEGALGTVSLLAACVLLNHRADYAPLLSGIALGLFVGAAIRLLDSHLRWPKRAEVLSVIAILACGLLFYQGVRAGKLHPSEVIEPASHDR